MSTNMNVNANAGDFSNCLFSIYPEMENTKSINGKTHENKNKKNEENKNMEAKNEETKAKTNTESTSENTAEVETVEGKRKLLKKLEREIKRNLTGFTKNGLLLKEIRDRKLYLTTDSETFEEYCGKQFNISMTHIYRLINHYEICQLLEEDYLHVPEKVTRPLSALGDEENEAKKKIWSEAKKARNEMIPTSHDIEVRVEKYTHEKEGEKAQEGEVYVRKFDKVIKKEELMSSFIRETKDAVELLNLSKEYKEYLTQDDFGTLKNECMKRIDDFMLAKTEDKKEAKEEVA